MMAIMIRTCVREIINLTPIPGQQAKAKSFNIIIDLGPFYFDDLSVSFSNLGVKRLKKPSIWGPDLERARIGPKTPRIEQKNAPIGPKTP